MKFLLKLILFIGAIALLWAAHYFYFYRTILIEYEGYVVEPALSLVLILLLLAMLLIYLAFRIIGFLTHLPQHLRGWHKRKIEEKQNRLIEESLRALALQDDSSAEKSLSLLASAGIAGQAARLLAAYCAESQGMRQKTAAHLHKIASIGEDSSPLKRIAQGSIALSAGRFSEALNEFRTAEVSVPKSKKLLQLIASCLDGMNDSQAALVAWLSVARLETPPNEEAIKNASLHLWKIQDKATLSSLCKEDLSGLIRENAGFACSVATQLHMIGMEEEANSILKRLIRQDVQADVLETAAHIGDDVLVENAIQTGEKKMMAGEGKNASLLRAMGTLYVRKQLWKKSREMLEASLSTEAHPATHEAFAIMLQAAGATPEEVIAQYRKALEKRKS